MENQHRKINGYRDLTKQDIDLMNEIKALGPQIEAVVLKVNEHIAAQREAVFNKELNATDYEEVGRLGAARPEYFSGLGVTSLQTGLMYLTRAVAQPTFF